jgi:D-hydroxyproline dehydrogenase subunit gamma
MKIVQLHKNPVDTVQVVFNAKPLHLPRDMTIAAGLLAAGVTHFRDAPLSGAPRGPFCMMGVCFDCLVIIDGIPNCQACMTDPVAGMVISRQAQSQAQSIETIK